ncbi:MAG: LysM peptidoglycan-binding domain-containing protein [Paracoccaceae bacterium]|jgi:nucleoid-associated protein YgaU|nr:LysM peptidoglycan-binding domain-containing protein [Paracoccaceae bacterium]
MSGSGSVNGLVVGGFVLCCVIGAAGYFAYQPSGNDEVVGAQQNALVKPDPVIKPADPEPMVETPKVEEAKVSEPLVEVEAETPPPTPEPVPQPEPEPVKPLETETPAPEVVETPQAEPEPAPTVEAKVEPEPEPVAEPEPDNTDIPPVFDLIRIDRSGAGLIAGRATPDTDIEIGNEGSVVGTARTGRDGAFVAYITVDPSIAAQELIAQAAGDQTSVATIATPVVVVTSADEDAEPVIFQPSEDGVRLIQPTSRPDDASVTLDSISYDAQGQVTFSGRARQSAAIRLYLDDQLTLETRAADDSSWRAIAGEAIAPGVYTLRVDQLNAAGAVTSRLETPFLREQIVEGDLNDNKLTVQTGNNLWKLAEGIYGAGTRYTLIYQANRDSIRDPDLIYPGQIFKLPDAAPTQ